MRAIFISYRRDDTEGYAGRLFRDLRERFGKDAVFMDVAGIEPGRDFRRVIEDQVASCGVLLAVIGKAWLTAADAHGKRRLDDPNDFVRLETASALKRDIPVIPVLVQQTEMLREDQLPEGLKDLAFRNSVELTHARWESDVELLIAALQRYVDPPTAGAAAAPPAAASAQPTSRHQAWVIAPLATLALGGIAYVAWDRLGPGSEGTKDAASEGTRIGAASATGGVVAPPPASAAAALPAAAAAPPSASAAVPVQASASAPAAPQAPAPAAVDADAARKTATNQAAPASSARRVDRPVAAKAPVAAPVASRPPAPAPMPAVPKVAVTTATATPAPSLPMEPPAAASPAPAPVVTAAAPAPAPEVAPTRHDRSLELLGMSGAASTVTRTIVIKPEMSYVNVTWGDVVRFEVGDKSFIWNFNGTRNSFDLAQVAPPEVLSRKVTAYVAPNPSFRRR
jgi:hypothetical protein